MWWYMSLISALKDLKASLVYIVVPEQPGLCTKIISKSSPPKKRCGVATENTRYSLIYSISTYFKRHKPQINFLSKIY